jgi:hypothetical protein
MSLIFEAVQRLESERGRLDARPGPEVVDLLRLAENKVASIRETASRATIEQARLSDPPAPAPLPVQLPAPAPSPALAVTSAEPPLQLPAGVRRAVSLVSSALPLVERILPLFEGNFREALSNLLTPPPPPAPAAPPAPPVDLAPIEDSLAQHKTLHSELRDQVIEQIASLASVEDRLEMVREATDRNTRQQQELIEDLRDFGKKINFVAMTTLGLLAISVGTSVALLLKIFKIIP